MYGQPFTLQPGGGNCSPALDSALCEPIFQRLLLRMSVFVTDTGITGDRPSGDEQTWLILPVVIYGCPKH